MGFREAALFVFVLLVSGGNLASATQNSFNFTTNETQTPPEQATTSSPLPRSQQTTDHQSNQMEQRDLDGSPISYRLRSYRLRNTDLNPLVKQESKVQVRFEQRVPVQADSVSVLCDEENVTIEVKQNFLGNGQLIRPSDLTLGGCAAVDAADNILQFQIELHSCGSTMTTTQDALIYTFSLTYSPTPISNTFILKTNPAEVVIECHYRRRHYVSSNAMRPTWKPFASNMRAEQQLHFSLRLMTEDWQSLRPSNVYFLSDVMHIEASVLQGHHIPLRVYVDSCVVTVNPDPNSQPSYTFINNYGCLTDAKLTGAKSYFMQRSQEDKLHFQLKAFRFQQDDRNSLYITCHLTATILSAPIDSQHKACSFLTEAKRWVASGGDNKVCSCCETSCSERRRRRSLAADAGLQWEGMAALGPVLLEESILEEELMELSELPPEPESLLQTQEVTQAALYSSTALLCGVGAALAVVLLAFMGAVICSRRHKPTWHSNSSRLNRTAPRKRITCFLEASAPVVPHQLCHQYPSRTSPARAPTM